MAILGNTTLQTLCEAVRKNHGVVGAYGAHFSFFKVDSSHGAYTLKLTWFRVTHYTVCIVRPPDVLKIGILTPLPKPGKKKGPPGNLRLIILLSVLRKLLRPYNLPHETNLGQIKNKNTLGPSSIPRRQKHNRTSFFP